MREIQLSALQSPPRTNAEEAGDDRHWDHQIRADRRMPQVAYQVPMPR
jgi:hypothetical protein